ncbi:beta-ketoacyl synthase N-terminal-like domain-containing protein [Nannocystis punicea]|uniref:beta-ketoacyl synthase N-terminal-like domain-containing protein n=1 Tax=Nannocystis punicea TaxID=2995304 RepID=UPI0035312FC2
MVLDATGEPVRASLFRRLAQVLSRTERAEFWARRAFSEVVPTLVSSGISAVPCFVASPQLGLGPAVDLRVVHRSLTDVARRGGGTLALEWHTSSPAATGRAGAFIALHAALELLARGGCPLVLVGAFDSCVDPATLRALSDANRLLGRRNPDGLLPGEGAAFVVLTRAHQGSSVPALGHVTNCALAREPHPRGLGGPYVAAGLTDILRELRQERRDRVDVVISAQTGEGCYGRGFSYAYLRNTALMPEPLCVSTLGASLGDAGAGAGAMALVVAVAGLQAGPVPGRPPRHRSALVYGESDDGAVGGCIIETVAQGRRR